MRYEIRYKPAFAAVFVTLAPGETLTAEAGAMASMSGDLSILTQLSGGFFSAILRKFLGGESLFVNVFKNTSNHPLDVVLTQGTIGDINALELNGNAICFQPGAYIAHSPGINMGVQWAGFSSWLSGEGLFRLKLSGNGLVFFGAYGGISPYTVNGEFIVDTGHLVAYDPALKMKVGLAGGLMGSMTSGEGLVNRLSGNGRIYLQSRSQDGLVTFLRPKVPS